MPYTPTSWIGGTTPANATNMNHLETQYSEAMLSFQADLITGFVEAGFVATKDGTIANQLDVTSGSAYIQQSDFTKRLHSNTSTTFTTSALSSTYHLYIQPDGTFYWNTANTPATGSLFIAQVTTDGSGNILAVTDERNLNPTLLPNLSGEIILPNVTFPKIGGQASAGSFGAPVIVAQSALVNVTVTTLQTILSFTPPATGKYRVSAVFAANNGGTNKAAIGLTYTGGISGAARGPIYFGAANGSVQDGTATQLANVESALTPLTIYASSAAAIACTYQNNSGSPNDHVMFTIERLA